MKDYAKGGLFIEDDGYYCRECDKWHPKLLWHMQFIEHFEKSRWIKRYISAVERFNGSCTPEQAEEQFDNHLSMCSLSMHPEEHLCDFCSTPTYFSNVKTGHFICSVKCKYADNNAKQDG